MRSPTAGSRSSSAPSTQATCSRRSRPVGVGVAGARSTSPMTGFDVVATTPVVLVDDVEEAAAHVRDYCALYIGGMGSREQNFYNQLACRMGFEEDAARIQDLYLAGLHREAAAAVPLEFIDETALLGSPRAGRPTTRPLRGGRRHHARRRRRWGHDAPAGRGEPAGRGRYRGTRDAHPRVSRRRPGRSLGRRPRAARRSRLPAHVAGRVRHCAPRPMTPSGRSGLVLSLLRRRPTLTHG